MIGHVLIYSRISTENGGRNTKTPALKAGAPFPFLLFCAFLSPLTPSPFCAYHAGYVLSKKQPRLLKATARKSSQTVIIVLANIVTDFIIVSNRCLVFVYYYLAGPLFPVTRALIG